MMTGLILIHRYIESVKSYCGSKFRKYNKINVLNYVKQGTNVSRRRVTLPSGSSYK